MNRDGFTLVEVMIIVLIIGLLSMIGIPYVLNAYEHSQQQVKARNVADVEKAKRILTLPVSTRVPGAMGLTRSTVPIQDDGAALSNLCEALRIASVDELIVGGDSITVGPLDQKAFY